MMIIDDSPKNIVIGLVIWTLGFYLTINPKNIIGVAILVFGSYILGIMATLSYIKIQRNEKALEYHNDR